MNIFNIKIQYIVQKEHQSTSSLSLRESLLSSCTSKISFFSNMFTVTMYILGLLINFGFNGMWGLVCVLQTCCVGRGVYNYHFVPPPPRGGKNVRVMGKKKTLERMGNEGGRQRRGKGKGKEK